MEKKTLLAVVLSIVVLTVFYVVQGIMFPPVQVATPNIASPSGESGQQVSPLPDQMETYIPMETSPSSESFPALESAASPAAQDNAALAAQTTVGSDPAYEERVTIQTELLTVILSSAGGDMVSWKLKQHKDNDDFVEMVLSGNREARAFTVAFGGLNAQPVSSLFHVNRISQYTVEFYRDFLIPNTENAQFRLTKRYDFKPDDYMFELTISLDGGFSVPGFNFGGSAYTLSFGPQIGPRFVKLDNYYDYRRYVIYLNGKLRDQKVNDSNPIVIGSSPKWAAISGKYFACIAVPLLAQYDLNFSERPEPGIPSASRMNIIRPPLNISRATDAYRFYLGPKSQETLDLYNTGNNSFGLTDMQFVEVSNTRGIWGILSPLEKVLKWFLFLFYKMVPNYGVAIILLTLLVKILLFPLTKKGSEATLRMQGVAPKIKELQEKYKDNRQKLNVEMAELYKKEGYNPLAGCPPLLLQLPIFMAMYSLFNNHFDLRGAMFIPGWIPDLSMPESIWDFPSGVRLPLLGWTALRLLPFLYVGSQLLYGKVTQTPDQQINPQMKMMLYVMPIVFFFVLYNMPSGLLVYWIFSNVLTMAQQMAINKYLAPKRAAQAAAAAAAAAASKASSPKKKKQK
ncbi:MAG: membrane protein insertase YidC [Treponema sp.]|jgi:YidC/Oxa1 family membrane protein insertase|nr:membrane protein insertase YidC [Treponema sp.]